MYPTKYFSNLMLAPFRQKKIALKFNADLEPISKIAAEIASSNGAIWDEFSEQH